jgi:hypothetical protein
VCDQRPAQPIAARVAGWSHARLAAPFVSVSSMLRVKPFSLQHLRLCHVTSAIGA